MSRRLATLALLLALAACGKEQPLKPRTGEALPPKPATAPAQPSVGQLLAPSVQSRPSRIDDVLSKSEERREDPFDIPPPG